MQNMPTPDLPQPFGYKCAWIAVRTGSPEAVAAALHLQEVAPSTWAEGIEAAHEGRVFVTPEIAGWVLAVGTVLADTGDEHNPDRISPVLLRLGKQFPEVQYFGTHRVVEWHAWARVLAGDFVRKFAYLGDQSVVIWQHGALTPEESRLGLVFTAATIDDGPFPDEQNVTDLAGLWSVDPTRLEDLGLPPSTGLLGVYPQ